MHNYTCPESCIPQIRPSYPLKNCPAVFAPHALLDELIPWNPSCCSFHAPGSFLPPWYPALKMTAPLVVKNCLRPESASLKESILGSI